MRTKQEKTKMISVLHIVYGMGLGGIENAVATLALDQKQRGCRVQVVCLYGGGYVADKLEQSSVEVIRLHLRRGLGMINFLFPLWRLCTRRKVDVLHFHVPGVTIPVAIVAKLKKIRLTILTIHSSPTGSGLQRLRGRLEAKITSRFIDQVVTVSKVLKQRKVQELRFAEEKIRLIPNGVDVEKFKPFSVGLSERSEVLGLERLKPGTFIVGMAAQLEHFKDIPTFMRAAARITKQNTEDEVLFIVAGTGSLETQLKQLACKMNMDSRFKFAGLISDMPLFMNSIDVFVLSSPYEGQSLVILEAMATATPVVTTDSGGVRDSVVDGETGFIVPVGDDKALADRILELLACPEKRDRMGLAGLQRVGQYFKLEGFKQSYWNIIQTGWS